MTLPMSFLREPAGAFESGGIMWERLRSRVAVGVEQPSFDIQGLVAYRGQRCNIPYRGEGAVVEVQARWPCCRRYCVGGILLRISCFNVP